MAEAGRPALAALPAPGRNANGLPARAGRSVSARTSVLEIEQHHRVGAHARAVVAQHRDHGGDVAGADRLAEGEVGRQDRRALLEPRLVLREQLAEHALALLQLRSMVWRAICELARITRTGAQTLHEHQQHHEEEHEPRLRSVLGQVTLVRLVARSVPRRSSGGLYLRLRGTTCRGSRAHRRATRPRAHGALARRRLAAGARRAPRSAPREPSLRRAPRARRCCAKCGVETTRM